MRKQVFPAARFDNFWTVSRSASRPTHWEVWWAEPPQEIGKLLCTGLFKRNDLLNRPLKSTGHGMLKSTGHAMGLYAWNSYMQSCLAGMLEKVLPWCAPGMRTSIGVQNGQKMTNITNSAPKWRTASWKKMKTWSVSSGVCIGSPPPGKKHINQIVKTFSTTA